MKYTRQNVRTEGYKKFDVGTHAATIKKVIKKPAKSGSKMFVLSLEGKNDEKGSYYLVFGNDYTEGNLNFLLSSIEDNGADIPDIDFGYNPGTFEFLGNKEVYIEVEDKIFNGKMQPQIVKFLTLDEFETSEQLDGNKGESDDDWD